MPPTSNNDIAIEKAAEVLKVAKRVAILTGAGISAESGVPTFRVGDGLWEGHRIEEVATPEAFAANPKQVWRFYSARRENLRTVQPNPGHYTLVKLEQRYKNRLTLATQNVDGLHAVAGSKRLLELHGNLRRTRCMRCEKIEDRGLEPLGESPMCPHCGGQLRPDIVCFNEQLPEREIDQALSAASECDCLIVIGTSAVVYPAAEMIPRASWSCATIIEINLAETEASHFADIGLYGLSGEYLPKIVERMGI